MSSNRKNPLEKMISAKTIALNIEAKDWKEAVRFSGELLVKNGYVEPRYIDAMIKTAETLGPYIVISPGVALPHARPEDGVLEPCMSLITLRSPVNFGNEFNDPVKLVVSFGTIDHKAHVAAFSKLARIIGNEEKVNAIIRADKVEQIENIISTT